MHRIFTAYGIIVLALFSFAAYQGYAFNSLFMNKHHANASENHYHK